MKKFQTIFSLICLTGVSLLSCAPHKLTTARWSNKSSAAVVAPPDLKSEVRPLTVGEQQLEFQTQSINGAEVEGSYYKKLFTSHEEKFISYRWLEKVPLTIKSKILLMKNEKFSVLVMFLKSNESFATKKLIEGPRLVLRDNENFDLHWRLTFQETDGRIFSVYLDRFFKIIEQKPEGTQFVEATALLYPMGPLQSKVSQVVLKRVSDDGWLLSNLFKITPQSGVLARAENNQFLYQQTDKRFEQVQIYFYLNQMTDWFLAKFKFQLPFLLEVETSVGFPAKTNTAFYYNHKIRLGDGDGEVFVDMALDPSIVIHESVHAVIQATAGLPYDGQGGSLNEGFADFFTASILKNPKLGEVSYKKANFKRTIENSLRRSDVNGGLYHDSGLISGLFWQISQEVGPEISQQLAWNILLRLNLGSGFDSFKEEFLDVLNQQEINSKKKILVILKRRGWTE